MSAPTDPDGTARSADRPQRGRATGTSWSGTAWSCTVRVVVADPEALTPAVARLTGWLTRVDRAASRFRADSDLSRANARRGRPVPVSPLLLDLVDAALAAAETTDGAVDPALGGALVALGYDRDIAELRGRDVSELPGTDLARDGNHPPALPVPGGQWRRVRVNRDAALLTVPAGAALDLGATAKAWTADRAAHDIAGALGTGVLVELGGDVAVAGERDGGWAIRVAEREGGAGQVVTLTQGGIATSTTTLRTWSHGSERRHHVVDPRTGAPTEGPWRTASVHAATAYDANVASTAALVLGDAAAAWLAERGMAARLVGRYGNVVTTPGWPGHDAPPAAEPRPARRTVTLHRRAVR